MSATSAMKCWGSSTRSIPTIQNSNPLGDSQHRVTTTCAPRYGKSAFAFETRELKQTKALPHWQGTQNVRKCIQIACAADGAQSAPAREKVQPSPGGSAGEDMKVQNDCYSRRLFVQSQAFEVHFSRYKVCMIPAVYQYWIVPSLRLQQQGNKGTASGPADRAA